MNIRLSLFTILMIMCNAITTGPIRDALEKERDTTSSFKKELEKNGINPTFSQVKEIALIAMLICMESKRTLDEAEDFSQCFSEANLMSLQTRSQPKGALLADALLEIKLSIPTNDNQDDTPIE